MIHEWSNNNLHYTLLRGIHMLSKNETDKEKFLCDKSECLIITGNEAHQVARTISTVRHYIQSIIVIELKNRVIACKMFEKRKKGDEDRK